MYCLTELREIVKLFLFTKQEFMEPMIFDILSLGFFRHELDRLCWIEDALGSLSAK